MIDPRVIVELEALVPLGGTILEIGTGLTTEELAKRWNVISIENDPYWHQGHSTLLHAKLISTRKLIDSPSFWKKFPEASRWYDPESIDKGLTGVSYDAILMDGPRGGARRAAMWWFYEKLFDTSVPVVVDDVQRHYDWKVTTKIAEVKGVDSFNVVSVDTKMFAVIK